MSPGAEPEPRRPRWVTLALAVAVRRLVTAVPVAFELAA